VRAGEIWETARASSTRQHAPPPPTHPPAKLSQAVLVMLLSLPALALRDPKLKGTELGSKPKFTILFMLLGVVAIPMWVPEVGTLVLTFTVAIPSESQRWMDARSWWGRMV